MNESWTLSELVVEVAVRLAELPQPKNGQVRAVPDERTIRYYGTLGLLDRPVGTRGRVALYGQKHLAQVVAIKRLQTMERSLAEIQILWPTLDDDTLSRMSGVRLASTRKRKKERADFWKREVADETAMALPPMPAPPSGAFAAMESIVPVAPVELRLVLAPNVFVTLAVPAGIALSQADVRAIRAAAAPLVTELANRQLTLHAEEEEL